MDAAGAVRLFRKEIADETSPLLWSDEEVYTYLDDAQKWFCRLTGGLADSTTATITSIEVDIAATDFPLSKLILKIRGAFRISDGRSVMIVNFDNMAKLGMRFDGRTGPIQALIIGMDPDTGRFWPVPDTADTVQLVTDRLPLCDIEFNKVGTQKLEIDVQHHYHLLDHMKALAYNKQDAETFNKSKSNEFMLKFEKYCDKAMKERERRIHRTRVVTYGGLPIQPNVQQDFSDYRRGFQ